MSSGSPPSFFDLHYDAHRHAGNTGNTTNALAYHRAREDKKGSDWIRSAPGTKTYTYLSMFGGTYHFNNDPGLERAAREAIARDTACGRLDFRDRPLALAECAFIDPDRPVGDRPTFPFYLDCDIKCARSKSHEDLAGFGRDVVLPALLSFWPDDLPGRDRVRLVVCAAEAPKDLTQVVCGNCDAPVADGADPCCTGANAVPRPLFKCSAHYRVWNWEALDGTPCPLVVSGPEAVAVTSAIFADVLAHPKYIAWGSADMWRDWCDVAPVSGKQPNLRVPQTVKSSRCHVCDGRKGRMERCVECAASGKVVDQRPYSVVACMDASGAPVLPLPTYADEIHVTSIRVRAPVTPGFRGPRPGIPSLVALAADVERARSTLRHEMKFNTLTSAQQKRLRLRPAPAAWRPRGQYRQETSPRVVASVQRAVRSVFNGQYGGVVVTHVFQQPGRPGKIVARVSGPGATYCYNRGPDAYGRDRGPGPHSSSEVYFVLCPSHGLRQRCFSSKQGAGEETCRCWKGGPWQKIADADRAKIWPLLRGDSGPGGVPLVSLVPPGSVAVTEDQATAGHFHQVFFRGIDRPRARRGEPQVDPCNILRCVAAILESDRDADVCLGDGFTPRDHTVGISRLLRRYNLDEPSGVFAAAGGAPLSGEEVGETKT